MFDENGREYRDIGGAKYYLDNNVAEEKVTEQPFIISHLTEYSKVIGIVLGVGIFLIVLTLYGVLPLWLWGLALVLVSFVAVQVKLNVGKTSQPVEQAQLVKPKVDSLNEKIISKISAIPLPDPDKRRLYDFSLGIKAKISRVLKMEKIGAVVHVPSFGIMTITIPVKLKVNSKSNVDKILSLGRAISQECGVTEVRIYQNRGFVMIEMETPTRAKVGVDNLRADDSGVTVGLDTSLKPVGIKYRSTGLFGIIGPSGSGKSVAARSVLYTIKRDRPFTDIVIVGFKPEDWVPFRGVATFISDKDEIASFAVWLKAELERRAKLADKSKLDRLIVVWDDFKNILSFNKGIDAVVSDVGSLGAGAYINQIIITQGVSAESGGQKLYNNCTARLVFKTSDNKINAANAGQAESGVNQLSGKRGDAMLIGEQGNIRIGTSMVTDEQIELLEGGPMERLWVGVAGKPKK